MTGDQTARFREHRIFLLKGGGAHLSFEKAIAGLPLFRDGTFFILSKGRDSML